MMFKKITLFVLVSFSLFSYEGREEVSDLFSRISDLYSPSTEDYLLIENFLKNGKRPYLNHIYNSDRHDRNTPIGTGKHRDCRCIMLIGPNLELPVFETYHVNCSAEMKERCITIFSTYNSPYPQKTYEILEELKDCGYVGHVLLRIGGYPNLSEGGIKLCHVPYSWKVAFFQEAISLGYENILWLDSSMHPMTDLSNLFQLIESNGYLLLSGGVGLDYGYKLKTHLPNAIKSLGVREDQLSEIPHLVSCVLGINTSSQLGLGVINEWYKETENVLPCMTWFPEELALSVVAWRLSAKPTMYWGLVVCTEENKHLASYFPYWNFLLDLKR